MDTEFQWLPQVWEKISTKISSGFGLACFDFDNTLFYGDLGEEVLVALARDGLSHVKEEIPNFFTNPEQVKLALKSKDNFQLAKLVWEEYESLLSTKGMEAAYRWSSFLFSGWKKEEFQKYCREVWNQAQSQKRIGIYSTMKSLIMFLKSHSWEILVVTASPTWAVAEVISEFQLESENVLGMNLKLSQDYSTSEILEPYPYGEGKLQAILNHKAKTPDLAFGDSINDLPMLSGSKLGVLLDRGRDIDLTQICNQKGILIQPLAK